MLKAIKMRKFLFFVCFIMVFFGISNAYEMDKDMCKCDSCEDCTKALSDGACSSVYLTRDIDESVIGKTSASCILNPAFGNGKIFDCNNHKIERCSTCGIEENSYGVYLRDKKDMVIRNCKFINFKYGINVYHSSNIKVMNNKFSGGKEGIYIREGKDCDVEKNVIEKMEQGIHLLYSDGNSIIDNDLSDIAGNNVIGIFLEHSDKNLIKGNNVNNGKDKGIFLEESNKNEIIKNFVNNNNEGIEVVGSSENKISENEVNKCSYVSIYLVHSTKNIILKNEANSNKKYGIYIAGSDENLISENKIKNNILSYGLYIDHSSNNNISKNLIFSNREGIHSIEGENFMFGNKVCWNNNYDFYSSNWMKSAGNDNYCDVPDGWNDKNKTGCTNRCICKSNDECDYDEFCNNGQCEKLNCDKIYNHKCVECLMDSDCKKSEKCEANKCVLKIGFCNSDNECKDDEKCENNKCIKLECEGDEKVKNHTCVKIIKEIKVENITNASNEGNISKFNEEGEKGNMLLFLFIILIGIGITLILYILFSRKK